MNGDSVFADNPRGTKKREIVRDAWMLLLSVFLLLVALKLLSTVNEQQAGRRLGTSITCVITSSVLQGSHQFIVASASQPLAKKLENRLVEEGYPNKATRELQAQAQADAYTKAISEAVVRAVGVKAKGLITTSEKESKGTRPAGAINCDQLKTITKVH